MHQLALGLSALLALAIIVVGATYLARPMTAIRGFGLPLPEADPNIAWWLRLKGVRDIAAGLTVLAVMLWGDSRLVGIVLLAETTIPVGDMLIVLARGASPAAPSGSTG